jgi:asparagine synthase (glutamine-hydrolysing)
MCRIAGLVSNRLKQVEIIEKVRTMCKALEHGGPDDEGIFTAQKANIVFGHRRLSIIDLSRNGHQPMADAGQNIWITFNGEIYNYQQLRVELTQAGAQFNSKTDTEVILQAYLLWGIAAFSKLRGMFAFALYDVAKGITYLVRDTAGIKPLYYHIEGGSMSFASEMRAFKMAGVANEADPDWPVRLLAFGHIPEPYTTLKNVLSLPKGHFLSWHHQSNEHRLVSYVLQTKDSTPISDFNTAKNEIRNSLGSAIGRQLIADAPIGVFLSGGIDSSLITLLANEQKKQELKTISIYFNEKEYDERFFQNHVLNKIGGEKFTHLVTQDDFEALFPKIMNDMDMPTTDGINTWFISNYAHQDGLKAVLSGVGADELFGGYPSFGRIKYLKYLRKIPSSFFRLANYFNTDRYKKISFLAYNRPIADYLLLRGLFIPEDIAKILDATTEQVNRILFNGYDIPDLRLYNEEHAAWFENNLYMQNQLLRDTDVMSMAHGLEVRVPFLDEDFQALVKNISPQIRFNEKQPKKLLVESFKDILPVATWNRPKMGFTFPLQNWMANHPEISNETLYRGEIARELVKKFKRGEMHWSKIFALYQIQLNG